MKNSNIYILDEQQLRKIITEEFDAFLHAWVKCLDKRPEDEPLTQKDVAKIFKVTTNTIHNWTKAGELTPYYKGRRLYYSKREVLAFLNKEDGDDHLKLVA